MKSNKQKVEIYFNIFSLAYISKILLYQHVSLQKLYWRYSTFYHSKSSKYIVHFTFMGHLNLDVTFHLKHLIYSYIS